MPGFLIILDVHHDDHGDVRQAVNAILRYLELKESDRIKPTIVSSQIIRAIEPYQAQLINRNRSGSMIIPGQSLYILETEPAGYAAYAANEAEKEANIFLIDVRPFGAYGRLYLSGDESEIDSAAGRVLKSLESLEGKTLIVNK
jgi:hypothetical protein